jgi:hypothetical protein
MQKNDCKSEIKDGLKEGGQAGLYDLSTPHFLPTNIINSERTDSSNLWIGLGFKQLSPVVDQFTQQV